MFTPEFIGLFSLRNSVIKAANCKSVWHTERISIHCLLKSHRPLSVVMDTKRWQLIATKAFVVYKRRKVGSPWGSMKIFSFVTQQSMFFFRFKRGWKIQQQQFMFPFNKWMKKFCWDLRKCVRVCQCNRLLHKKLRDEGSEDDAYENVYRPQRFPCGEILSSSAGSHDATLKQKLTSRLHRQQTVWRQFK